MSLYHPNHWSRRLVASGLVFLTVLTTAVLAWESWRASRSARATAEAVLRDYSTFAAWQFAREAETRLHALVNAATERVRHDFDGQHAPRTMPGLGLDADCGCAVGPPVATSFKLAVGRAMQTLGEPLSDPVVELLRSALNDAGGAGSHFVKVVDGKARPQLLLFQVYPGRPRQLIGAVHPVDVLSKTLAEIFASSPLLPQSLTGGAHSSELFSVRVTDADRGVLFSTGGDSAGYTGVATLPMRLGSMEVHAAIAESRAPSLVIGGFPSSRWPLTVALFGLATALAVLAVRQMQREVRFAQRQADFVSGVSHELRTPLAQIRLFGETLLLGRVRNDDERRRAAEVIVQEARRLGSLVDTVLLFSRIQRGRIEVEPTPVDVPALVSDIVEGFRPFAGAKRATIEVDCRGLGEVVALDPNVCRQVLLNLLDNAVKYGPPGQTVRVTASRVPSGVILDVTDDGPGIDAQHAAQIWEPFWRAPDSSEGGSGLGLAIVGELSQRHGGSATVGSRMDGRPGARFVVALNTGHSEPA